MKPDFNNLVEAVAALSKDGYTEDFKVLNDGFFCPGKKQSFRPEELVVDAVYRFEENADPADNSVLYAISAPQAGFKGLLIDAFGVYASDISPDFLQKLQYDPVVLEHQANDPEGYKYGVPKVYKAQFDAQPDRYELRLNDENFPACPWGNSFSMLGYDKREKQYVWLVSSILRDERLKRVDYA